MRKTTGPRIGNLASHWVEISNLEKDPSDILQGIPNILKVDQISEKQYIIYHDVNVTGKSILRKIKKGLKQNV
jgi:hypothetical protein